MEIREAKQEDLIPLLELYTQLNDNPIPMIDSDLNGLWKTIQTDPNHHILMGYQNDQLICSCVLIIIPNLTHQQRPYALIENVITHQQYRKQGYATAMLAAAKELAVQEHCYKIMLMTGSKKESTLLFYERSGFNRQDKTAFIQWLP